MTTETISETNTIGGFLKDKKISGSAFPVTLTYVTNAPHHKPKMRLTRGDAAGGTFVEFHLDTPYDPTKTAWCSLRDWMRDLGVMNKVVALSPFRSFHLHLQRDYLGGYWFIFSLDEDTELAVGEKKMSWDMPSREMALNSHVFDTGVMAASELNLKSSLKEDGIHVSFQRTRQSSRRSTVILPFRSQMSDEARINAIFLKSSDILKHPELFDSDHVAIGTIGSVTYIEHVDLPGKLIFNPTCLPILLAEASEKVLSKAEEDPTGVKIFLDGIRVIKEPFYCRYHIDRESKLIVLCANILK